MSSKGEDSVGSERSGEWVGSANCSEAVSLKRRVESFDTHDRCSDSQDILAADEGSGTKIC